MNSSDDDQLFVAAHDFEEMEAAVLAAAIAGDSACRAQLRVLYTGFDEPYRTIAAVLLDRFRDESVPDQHTLQAALGGKRLVRQTADGRLAELSAQEALNLVVAVVPPPGHAAAYLPILREQLVARRRTEFKERAIDLAKTVGGDPRQFLDEIAALADDAHRNEKLEEGSNPSELMEVIPYVQRLMERQTGAQFLGLDSGFEHFNNLCNGLDTGLCILAAPPGAGKTTWAFQVACQVAATNHVPVIFVSLEQSKEELRAKALARLSKLQYRHLLRGRLRFDDPQDSEKVLAAARQYALTVAPYLTIVEGDEKTTHEKIYQEACIKLAKTNAERCLVVLDYLQILPSTAEDGQRATSPKDRVDQHVSALRRVARKLSSPVLAISAENRAGYRSKTMEVFKESGGIEYSADIAMVLTNATGQAAGSGNESRAMDLNIVKNRNGERGVVKLKFYPQRAEFVETGKEDFVDETNA